MLPYFICSQDRSGTHLIVDYLRDTGCVGNPRAWFREKLPPDFKERLPRPVSGLLLLDYMKRIRHETRSPNGVWGIKVFPPHTEINDVLHLNGIPPHEYKWVWLRRENKVRQAISSLKLEHTGQSHRTKDDPVYENIDIVNEQIRRRIGRLVAWELGWSLFFERHNLKPHTLVYEQIAELTDAERTPHITGILDYLGVEYPTNLEMSTTHCKMSTDFNDRLYEKYLSAFFSLLPKAGGKSNDVASR